MRAAVVAKRELHTDNVHRLQRDAKVEIVCEDNLRFMRRLEEESMHLIVTSPPYNIGKEYESRKSQAIYIEEQAACIAEAARLLHPRGSICWQVGNQIGSQDQLVASMRFASDEEQRKGRKKPCHNSRRRLRLLHPAKLTCRLLRAEAREPSGEH